jgi:uncharacterized protein (DUF362 family)
MSGKEAGHRYNTWAPITTDKRSVVAIVKGQDPDRMTKEALDYLGGMRNIVKPGDTVFIKPNLIAASPYTMAETTDPRFCAALITAAKEAGAGEVIVGENTGWGLSTREAAKVNGMEEWCTKAGVDRFAWFEEEEDWVELEIPNGVLCKKAYVPKVILDSDVIINVPVMKNNFTMVTTLSIKNWLGLVPYHKVPTEPRYPNIRAYTHKGVFQIEMAYYLADLMTHPKLRPDLTLITAIYAMEGYGPHGGPVVNMDCCIASTDTVAAEAVAEAVMGYDPFYSPTTQVAHFRGIGTANLDEIEIKGARIEEVQKPFKPATFRYINGNPNVTNYCGGVCGGCVWAYGGLPIHAPPEYVYDPNKKYAVLVGRRILVPENFDEYDELWLCGDCANLASHQFPGYEEKINRFKDQGKKIVRLTGCPPLEWFTQFEKMPEAASILCGWGFNSLMNPHTDGVPPNRPDLRTRPLGKNH